MFRWIDRGAVAANLHGKAQKYLLRTIVDARLKVNYGALTRSYLKKKIRDFAALKHRRLIWIKKIGVTSLTRPNERFVLI